MRLSRGPNYHSNEQWQREKHTVHDHRHRIYAVAISQFNDDRFAAKGYSTQRSKDQSKAITWGMFKGRSQFKLMGALVLSKEKSYQCLEFGKLLE